MIGLLVLSTGWSLGILTSMVFDMLDDWLDRRVRAGLTEPGDDA